jgi:sigma-B regulation protein RsbU (phosphoserine phosphatase)
LFYGVLDGATGVLRYSNAGHLPPIVARGDGSSARLTEGGPVLGLLGGSAYREGGIRLDPGDRIVLCTDGVTEATNPAGEEFGERRLIDLILRNRGCSSLYLHDVLLDAVRGFAGRLQDDLTLLTVTAAAARPV